MGEAQRRMSELRQSTRYCLKHTVAAEHPALGELDIHVVNISQHGFMTDLRAGIMRGDRVWMRLGKHPRLEAVCIWTRHQRAGFHFERPLQAAELRRLLPQGGAITEITAACDARQASRKRMLAVARLYTRAGRLTVRVKDISPFGARIVLEREDAVAGDVLFERGPDFVAAKIAWLNGKEAGIHFYRDIAEGL